MFGLPVKLSETPGDPKACAPRIGEHNEQIYRQKLGLKKEYLDELREKGTI
jgi:CoA:oxalate CoA-transferase